MFLWFNSFFGGFSCFMLSLAFAGLLIFWRGARRMDCPTCRQRNPSHAHYCARCGTQLHN